MGSVRCKHINPDILRWARETAGYEQPDEVSKLLNFQELKKWEDGESYPTYDQLEELASCYERPTVLFFFAEVPEEKPIEHSCRPPPADSGHHQESPASIKLALRRGKCFQIRLHELTDGNNPCEELIVDAVKITGFDDVKKGAADARKLLGVDLNQQKGWCTSRVAVNHWRDALSAQGVFVLKESRKKNDRSGFCIYDEQFPIVFVNKTHHENRQIFTLFHELAHLIIFRSGGNHSYSKLEKLCNIFAGEFLLPAPDFTEEVKRFGSNYEGLAQHYCVSPKVVKIKMEQDHISPGPPKELKQAKTEPRTSGQQDSFYTDRIDHLGKHYIELVLEKYNQKQITTCEAADYLYIGPTQVDQLNEEYLSDQR